MTDMRPDLIIWSREAKIIIIGELSVPGEDNIDEGNEFKRAKHQELVFDIESRGWTVHLFPFELKCLGFSTNSLYKFISRLGTSSRLNDT